MMSFPESGLLLVAAMCGGALNSVAGGGSFLTFPALIFVGVPPIAANATSTVALWPGSLASTGAYRRDLRSATPYLVPFAIASLLGGFLGAKVLLRTSSDDFRALVPWLLLVATLVFALGGTVAARLRGASHAKTDTSRTGLVVALIVQFAISIYGGFFGGGMGILMLATLAILGMHDIHAMNGIKNFLAVCINGIAVFTFVAARAVVWPEAILMLSGAVVGGYGGAFLARRINPLWIRGFVIALGLTLSAYFFLTY